MTLSPEYRRILSRMGYYTYQNGLIYRHLGQEGGWDGHLTRCRQYILHAVEHFKPSTVTILGSGWLLDIPLAEIIGKTEKVILADIIHPPDVIAQIAGLEKVSLMEEDVTGGLIMEIWNKTGRYSFFKRMRSLSDIRVPLYKPDFDPGLIISLNLLTQLEILPVGFLKKKSAVTEVELTALKKDIQDSHLRFLAENRSVVITDVAEVQKNRNDEERSIQTLLTEMPQGSNRKEWTWDFDLRGSDYYNCRSIMKVVALTYGQ